MAKDKSEKKEKKEKKEKRAESDGVKKSKKDKKEKKSKSDKEVAALLDEAKTKEPSIAPVTNGASASGKQVNGVDFGDENVQLKTVPKEALVPFANPLADEKQTRKVLKGVKKAAKQKVLKRGVKEVVKSVRKMESGAPSNSSSANPPGIVVLAADISPMDVISHIPVLCEDHNIPYIYVQSRAELGMAGNTKRPTSVVMVAKDRGKGKEVDDVEYKEAYADLLKLVMKAGGTVRI